MGVSQSYNSLSKKKNYNFCDLGNKNIANLTRFLADKKGLLNSKITHLVLYNNVLSELPSEIFLELTSLCSLDLSFNLLENLPLEVFNQVKLFELRLSFNNFSRLSKKIQYLTNLTDLEIQGNQLKKLPNEISALQNLSRLDIRSNLIEEIGDYIGELTNLTILRASYNAITDISPAINKLSKLKIVTFKMNCLKEFPEIPKWKQLESLDLSNNELESLPESLAECHSIISLLVSNNNLKNLCDLHNFPNLQVLNISDNKITEIPDDVSNLINLRKFDANENEISSIPSDVDGMEKVEHIGLKSNKLSEIPDEIFNLPNLKSLDLSFNSITELPQSFGNAVELLYCSFDYNKISTIPEGISNLTNLRVLGLGKNNLDDKAFEGLELEKLNDLVEMRVFGNALTKVSECLSTLPSLERLYVGYNSIDSFESPLPQSLLLFHGSGNLFKDVPDEIISISKLKFLWLNGCQIDKVNSRINAMKDLCVLDLSSNRITSLPKTINELKYVIELNLSDNLLRKVPSFDGLKNLNILDLSFNKELSSIPKSLQMSYIIKHLKLNYCNISDISNLALFSYKWIALEGNPIVDIPENIISGVDIFRWSKKKKRLYESIKQDDYKYFNEISVSEMQGPRPTMEDSYLIKESQPLIAGNKLFSLFVIFDGHADSETAEFCATHFHIALEKCLEKALKPPQINKTPKKSKRGLKIKGDESFEQKTPTKRGSSKGSQSPSKNEISNDEFIQLVTKGITKSFYKINKWIANERLNSGSTVALALFHKENLWTASCGDARVTMCYNNEAIRLTTDHKASNLSERRRVHGLGGFVTENGRVLNRIAISRSLGDKEFQPYVSCEPEIEYTKLDENSKFLILACDGLWDVVSDSLAVQLVEEYYEKHQNYKGTAMYLRDLAYVLGSSDNISTMVLGLGKQDD